jgi:S1-C subfamily serine protease
MKRIVGFGVMALTLTWGIAASAEPVSRLGDGQRGGIGAAHIVPGYLGIDFRDISDDQVPSLKLKDSRGVEIIRVDHDGPAGKMGLREHDVVLQMNGIWIEGEDPMRHLLHGFPPGRTVAFLISRDGQVLTVTAQLADKSAVERQAWEQHLTVPQAPVTGLPSEDPAGSAGNAAVAGAPPSTTYSKGFLGTILLTPAYTGVMLERIGPQLSQFFGVPRGTGLLVKGVEMNSPAAVAGIRAGDVVVRANAKAVENMADWAKVVREAKGRPVTVVVLRDHKETIVMVTPDAKKHT